MDAVVKKNQLRWTTYLVIWCVKRLCSLRYKVKIIDQEEVINKIKNSSKGLLILPSHPALIDPFIIYSHLFPKFHPDVIVDEKQLERPGMGIASRVVNLFPLPDFKIVGLKDVSRLDQVLYHMRQSLLQKKHILIYPAGQIKRQSNEDLSANSMVFRLLKGSSNDWDIVLVRTIGLWGSSFGLGATGKYPSLTKISFIKKALILLANFLFFTPRRKVRIDLKLLDPWPKYENLLQLNHLLEKYYNEISDTKVLVPYFWWQKELNPLEQATDENWNVKEIKTFQVDKIIYQKIMTYLQDKSQVQTIKLQDRLAHDLGIDSIGKAEIAQWLEENFNTEIDDHDKLCTVDDVYQKAIDGQ